MTDDLDMHSTLTLLSEVRVGNERALEVLFARHRRALRNWGRGRVPPNARNLVDTEDVVQEVLSRTFAHLGSFDPRHSGAFRAYLRRSFFRQVIDQGRRAQRRPAPDETPNAVLERGPSPEGAAIQLESVERYERALSKLDPSDRELVIARIELGLKYQEIATELRKPSPDAARKAVAQAVKRLAEKMAKDAETQR